MTSALHTHTLAMPKPTLIHNNNDNKIIIIMKHGVSIKNSFFNVCLRKTRTVTKTNARKGQWVMDMNQGVGAGEFQGWPPFLGERYLPERTYTLLPQTPVPEGTLPSRGRSGVIVYLRHLIFLFWPLELDI